MYLDLFLGSLQGYFRYLLHEIAHPHLGNYVYWLVGISLAVYGWELLLPWRKKQPRIRKDFWLDSFYMFFNFFLFNLIGFAAVSTVAGVAFEDGLANVLGVTNLVALHVESMPAWGQVLFLFVARDLVQWNIHHLLHRVPLLWTFHQVHHSVEQMGFAAHLRFHWMETVVYRTLEYIPLAMIGFGVENFLIAHLVALLIGHLNHANIVLPLGPLKYLFNNPQMHIWHHALDMPEERPYGFNYGISLSVWDYLFQTAYIPSSGRDIVLGIQNQSSFPSTFIEQVVYPFIRPETHSGS